MLHHWPFIQRFVPSCKNSRNSQWVLDSRLLSRACFSHPSSCGPFFSFLEMRKRDDKYFPPSPSIFLCCRSSIRCLMFCYKRYANVNVLWIFDQIIKYVNSWLAISFMLIFVIFIYGVLIIYATIFKRIVKHESNFKIQNSQKWSPDCIFLMNIFSNFEGHVNSEVC